MNTKNLAIVAFISLSLAACKKDDPVPPVTPPVIPTTGTVKLSYEFMSGMTPFDFAAAHTDGAGNEIRFTSLKFYVSGVHLKDDEGVTVADFHDVYILVDAAATENLFTLGTMTEGHIHKAHFTLGLDSATNYADPTLAAYPLNIPGMHWSWNPTAGYKFVNMEGYVDVNGNGAFDDGVDVSFTYHCAQNTGQAASNPVLRETHVETHTDLEAGTTKVLEAKVDVVALLAGVDLAATPVAMGNGAGNQLLMDNLVLAIEAH